MDTSKFSPEQQAAWAQVSKDPEARAEVIVEVVKPNHVTNTYMNYLMKSSARTTDTLPIKRVRKGIRIHTLVPGAVHMASEITVTDRANFILDGADVKITYNADELARGDIGTLADIRQEMNLKLRDYYFNKTFTALSTIWNGSNTPSNYTELGTAITATALENAIDRINLTTGGVKAVIGSRRALTPVTKFGAFWGEGTPSSSTISPRTANQVALEEVRQTGWLGTYYGAPIIGINQVFDSPDTYQPLLPEDKIIVIGENVGEFITYGPVRTKAWTDWNPTPQQEFLEIWQQFGQKAA